MQSPACLELYMLTGEQSGHSVTCTLQQSPHWQPCASSWHYTLKGLAVTCKLQQPQYWQQAPPHGDVIVSVHVPARSM